MKYPGELNWCDVWVAMDSACAYGFHMSYWIIQTGLCAFQEVVEPVHENIKA